MLQSLLRKHTIKFTQQYLNMISNSVQYLGLQRRVEKLVANKSKISILHRLENNHHFARAKYLETISRSKSVSDLGV